ncbi:hypothetical protein, partial [Vibrio parahaemolyticus]|uniref:hypothetical protein n=1 Tax=Vibrio parahaemolyticus TaxID=670 RepID=UPI00301C7E75
AWEVGLLGLQGIALGLVARIGWPVRHSSALQFLARRWQERELDRKGLASRIREMSRDERALWIVPAVLLPLLGFHWWLGMVLL